MNGVREIISECQPLFAPTTPLPAPPLQPFAVLRAKPQSSARLPAKIRRSRTNQALDVSLEQNSPEINEESDRQSRKFQVSHHLLLMNPRQLLDRLDFDNNQPRDNEVCAKTFVVGFPFYPNGNGHLPLHGEALAHQHIGEHQL